MVHPIKPYHFCPYSKEEGFMTKEQRSQIIDQRKQGCGYATIAKSVAVSINTIKSFCRRNGLAGGIADETTLVCSFCGVTLEQRSKTKPNRFCSENCRRAWWKEHPNASFKKAYYEKVCAFCGKHYTVYGRPESKYCCLDCAHNARKA